MKIYLLLSACLILSGCERETQSQREIIAKLDALSEQVAAKQATRPRWAFANKREIENAIFQYSREKMERAEATENISAETKAKIAKYQRLDSLLMQMRVAQMRPAGLPPRPAPPGMEIPEGLDYATLSNQVAEARAPIVDILDRRNRLESKYRDEFSVESLIAEYAKDQLDLVVDSSNEHFARESVVLFRKSGDAMDITDGVLKLLKEKTKP